MPSVSIIIPTYNRAHLLARSIKSVLEQTYRDFELIVVDDGSTDNTKEIVRGFDDKRVRYIRRNKNSGTPAIPTNEGIRTATSGYIAIQDSDDEWLPAKLEKQMEIFKNQPPTVGVVYTDMWRIREGGKKEYWRSPKIMPADGIIYKDALGYRVAHIGTQTLVIRSECFNKIGMFDEKIPMFIDTEFLIRLSRQYYFYHIKEPLVNYFATPGSIASSIALYVTAKKFILDKYFEDIKKSKRLLAFHYFGIGGLLISNGDVKQGRDYLVKATLSYPLDIRAFLLFMLSALGQRTYTKVTQIYQEIRGLGS